MYRHHVNKKHTIACASAVMRILVVLKNTNIGGARWRRVGDSTTTIVARPRAMQTQAHAHQLELISSIIRLHLGNKRVNERAARCSHSNGKKMRQIPESPGWLQSINTKHERNAGAQCLKPKGSRLTVGRGSNGSRAAVRGRAKHICALPLATRSSRC